MKLRAAGVLAGLTLSLALGACAGHTTTTVVPTSAPQTPTATQNGGTAYQLGVHDALSDIHNGVGPAPGQSAYRWCDLELYGGDGAINDGGDAGQWFAGCQAGVAQAGVTP